MNESATSEIDSIFGGFNVEAEELTLDTYVDMYIEKRTKEGGITLEWLNYVKRKIERCGYDVGEFDRKVYARINEKEFIDVIKGGILHDTE